ncbi:MAG: hypothetical protein EAZ97_11445 [Bacteroidetes bacterium]|nr:MAG: hypothetical protein EAZ97_11445 [Bacteroidota bacterium]
MKKIWKSHLGILFLWLLLSTCGKEEALPIGIDIEFSVFDNRFLNIERAQLYLFKNEDDFKNNRNPVDSAYTNKYGKAVIRQLNAQIKEYYVSATFGDANNFSGKIKTGNLNLQPDFNTVNIQLLESRVSNFLAGRFEKRWKQLYQEINGSRYEICEYQKIFSFRRDGTIDIYYPAGRCSPTGSEIFCCNNIWTPDGANFVMGPPSNPKEIKNLTILTINETTLKYYYKPVNSDFPVTILEEYQAVK